MSTEVMPHDISSFFFCLFHEPWTQPEMNGFPKVFQESELQIEHWFALTVRLKNNVTERYEFQIYLQIM